MLPTISLVVFAISFAIGFLLLRIVLYIFDYYKKIASIPSAPGRSWLFGHLEKLYKIKKLEHCSWVGALYLFVNRVAASNRTRFLVNGIDIGVYKIYFGPVPVVVVSSPEAAESVFKTTGIQKPLVYKLLHMFGKGLPNISGEEYKYHKKVMLNFFRNIDVMDRVNKHFHRFTESIGEDGIIRDLFPTATSFADSISSEALTKQSMFLDQQNQRLDGLKTILDFFVSMPSKPWLMHKSLWRFFREGRQMLQYLKKNDISLKCTEEVIKDLDSVDEILDNGQPTLMNLLIQEHLKNPHAFTKHDVANEMTWVWIASFDTIALSLTYLLLEVGHRPDIQEKIFAELNSILSPDQEITVDDMHSLPYLEAVVKESLRRHPPGPLLPKQAVEDIKIPRINGEGFMTIPKATMVFIDTHGVNHNPRHWKEPEEFNPNRFLSEKYLTSDHPYSHVSFSAGKRVCPGKKIGYLILQTIVAKLVQTYHIQSLNALGSIEKEFKVILTPVEAVAVKFINRT